MDGTRNTGVAISISNLAYLCIFQDKLAKAKFLFERAFKIQKHRLGMEHADTARTMEELGLIHYLQGELAEAELLLLQSLAMQKRQLGVRNIRVAKNMAYLANLYTVKGRFAEAEELFQQALQIYEQLVLDTHYDRIATLKDYAHLLRLMTRDAEARSIEERILHQE